MRVAVITGGMGGLGDSISTKMHATGYRVVVTHSPSNTKAKDWLSEHKASGREFSAYPVDVADFDSCKECVARIAKEVGPVDILVNNAGAYDFKPLEEVTETEFHREFNTNVLGLLLATQEAAKHFSADGGSVINVSSVASSATPPHSAIYTATKGAVDAITRVLAKELGPRKIRINAVNPGPIETEGFHAIGIPGSDFEKQMVAQTPLGRIGQPRDVAPVVAFLASSESEWITGETIETSGGTRVAL